jgi:hypothetical protein
MLSVAIFRGFTVGFSWWVPHGGAPRTSIQIFDERLNDLMAFEAKYGHCDVPCTGDDVESF